MLTCVNPLTIFRYYDHSILIKKWDQTISYLHNKTLAIVIT